MATLAARFLQTGSLKQEEKKLIEFIKPIDITIKEKLHGMASSGFGADKPCLITIELIKDSIAQWKQEKQIYSQEITQTNCTELALSFRKILQISNLENLINVHTLRLDNNMIMKIEGLSKLKNIKWLDLSFNFISEIEGLDELDNLQDLSLYNNQITEVKNLDKNRKLNVLSVGRNKIADVKPMVTYLRKFGNLQALCVHMNTFCKDDDSVQKILEQNQKQATFPGSYDVIIENLVRLKYLDWKPIDEEYRKQIRTYSNAPKDENAGKEELDEEKMLEEKAKLHNADLDEIIDFFPRVLQNIKEDVSTGVTWENLIKIPGLDDQIKLTEKAITEDINKYKEEILILQAEKDKTIAIKKKEIDANEEKFIVKSKEMIRTFKRTFKSFVQEIQSGKLPNIKSTEDGERYIGLDKLKNDLLEIEVYAKTQLIDAIKNFKKDISEKNQLMQEKTDNLRSNLDNKKNALKEKITTMVTELKNKLDAYRDAIDNKPEDVKEGEEGDVPKDEEMEELYRIFQMADFNSDLEKITEVLDDRISKLRDHLENARTMTTDKFFNDLNTNDYYRNKKRIQDIQEIYDIYFDKVRKEVDANTKKSSS
jgi:Leucine-rich repeat (LRR) protein